MEHDLPALSVIIPARNARSTLKRCLAHLKDQTYSPLEMILVDDASTDSTPGIARGMGLRVVVNSDRTGPAAARNRGAELASGEVLLFVDADVLVPPELCESVALEMASDPSIDVVQTLYTPKCPAADSVSRYQNLYYHFALARMRAEHPAVLATWCTAIRSKTFKELGGFDARIPEPTVEDEELGYAIADRGGRIALRKDLQVTHLAEYTLADFVRRRLRMARAQAKSGWRLVSARLLKRYVNLRETGTHHSRWVVLSILLTACAALLIPFGLVALALGGPWTTLLAVAPVLTAAALACHIPFFRETRRRLGGRVLPVFAAICLLDMLVLALGIVSGTVRFFAGQRY